MSLRRSSLNENDIVSLGANWMRFLAYCGRMEAVKAEGHRGTRFVAHKTKDETFWFTTEDGQEALFVDKHNHLVLKPKSENIFTRFKIEYMSNPTSLPGFYAHFESCDKPGHFLAVGPKVPSGENSISPDACLVGLSTETNGDSVIAVTYLGTAGTVKISGKVYAVTECLAIDFEGTKYTFPAQDGIEVGRHYFVEGDVAKSSICMEGTPINVTRVSMIKVVKQDPAIVFAAGYGSATFFDFEDSTIKNLAAGGFTHVLVDASKFDDSRLQSLKKHGLSPMLDFTDFRKLDAPQQDKIKELIAKNNKRLGSESTQYLTSGEATDLKAYCLMDRWNNCVKDIPNASSYMVITHKHNKQVDSRVRQHVTNIDNIGINAVRKDSWATTRASCAELCRQDVVNSKVAGTVFVARWVYRGVAGARDIRTSIAYGTRTLWYFLDGGGKDSHAPGGYRKGVKGLFRTDPTGTFTDLEASITGVNTFAKGFFEATEQADYGGTHEVSEYVDECARIVIEGGKTITIGKFLWYRSKSSLQFYYLVFNHMKEKVSYNVKFRDKVKDKPEYTIAAVQEKTVPHTAYEAPGSLDSSEIFLWRIDYLS